MVKRTGADAAGSPAGGVGQRTLIAVVVVAVILAAVALAFAGWEPVAIVGLLTAVLALVVPLLSINSQAAEIHKTTNGLLSNLRVRGAQLEQTLSNAGMDVPADPALQTGEIPRTGAPG
jgi:hypothetical protein